MFTNRISTKRALLVIAAITLITLLTMHASLEHLRERLPLFYPPEDGFAQDSVPQPANPDTYYPLPPGKQAALDNPLADITNPEVMRDLAKVRRATVKYHNVDAALSDGFVQTPACISEPGSGGMGIHFIHPDRLMDPAIKLLEPEILL